MSSKKYLLTFVVIAFNLLAMTTASAGNMDNQPIQADPRTYVDDDATWPVVSRKMIDGVEYVTRRAPDNWLASHPEIAAEGCGTEQSGIQPAWNCKLNQYISRQASKVTWSSGYKITQFNKSYVAVWCHNQNCDAGPVFFKLKKAEAWWTRTSTKWTVKNAVHRWGCEAHCENCSGDLYARILEGGFTVNWQSDTRTYTYIWPQVDPPWQAATERVESVWPYNRICASHVYNGTTIASPCTTIKWDGL